MATPRRATDYENRWLMTRATTIRMWRKRLLMSMVMLGSLVVAKYVQHQMDSLRHSMHRGLVINNSVWSFCMHVWYCCSVAWFICSYVVYDGCVVLTDSYRLLVLAWKFGYSSWKLLHCVPISRVDLAINLYVFLWHLLVSRDWGGMRCMWWCSMCFEVLFTTASWY